MDIKNEIKVRTVVANVPYKVYERFKTKSYEEGYSMQVALGILMEYYSDDKLIIKE